MKKTPVLIDIVGTQVLDGEKAVFETHAPGLRFLKEGHWRLLYQDRQEGLDKPVLCELSFSDEALHLVRKTGDGSFFQELTFSHKRTFPGTYQSVLGTIPLTVTTGSLLQTVTPFSLHIELRYKLYSGKTLMGDYTLDIRAGKNRSGSGKSLTDEGPKLPLSESENE